MSRIDAIIRMNDYLRKKYVCRKFRDEENIGNTEVTIVSVILDVSRSLPLLNIIHTQ